VNEEQTQVPTDKLGEKDLTTDQKRQIERTRSNTLSANVELQEILVNMLNTLQVDKLETMASVKENVKRMRNWRKN
jgi:hypothetical protein